MRRDSESYASDLREIFSPLADLVSTWSSDPKWTNKSGLPLALPFSGGDLSFQTLAAETVGDRPIGPVRRELERLGAVDFSDSSSVRLVRPHLIPSESDERLISALSYSLRALAETVGKNCADGERSEPLLFERYIESRDLTPSEVNAIKHALRGKLEEFSSEVHAMLSPGGNASSDSARRIGVGFYYSE